MKSSREFPRRLQACQASRVHSRLVTILSRIASLILHDSAVFPALSKSARRSESRTCVPHHEFFTGRRKTLTTLDARRTEREKERERGGRERGKKKTKKEDRVRASRIGPFLRNAAQSIASDRSGTNLPEPRAGTAGKLRHHADLLPKRCPREREREKEDTATRSRPPRGAAELRADRSIAPDLRG